MSKVKTGTIALALALCLGGCASVPEVKAPDPGETAHKLRIASERACNAYIAALKAGLIQPNLKADLSCRAVYGVCSDPLAGE